MNEEVPVWEDPRRVLSRHGLAPKRGFSQNFLISKHAVEKIAEALAPMRGEKVVELGPGLGTLTSALLRKGAHVIAIDRDRDMLDVLGKELGHLSSLDARYGDATEIDLATLAQGAKIAVVGNLPYAVTGGIFRRLGEQFQHVDRAVLMVQKEVRDRLLAEPGTKAYGALTVFTRSVFDVLPVIIVPSGAFYPPPKVDSAVVELRPRQDPIDVERGSFAAVVRASFEARRKTLRNALLRVSQVDQVDAALSNAGIDPKRRGETLTPEELAKLSSCLDAAIAANK